jgi:hypothetical protein
MCNILHCPHCANSDPTMMDTLGHKSDVVVYLCEVCSKVFEVKDESQVCAGNRTNRSEITDTK